MVSWQCFNVFKYPTCFYCELDKHDSAGHVTIVSRAGVELLVFRANTKNLRSLPGCLTPPRHVIGERDFSSAAWTVIFRQQTGFFPSNIYLKSLEAGQRVEENPLDIFALGVVLKVKSAKKPCNLPGWRSQQCLPPYSSRRHYKKWQKPRPTTSCTTHYETKWSN